MFRFLVMFYLFCSALRIAVGAKIEMEVEVDVVRENTPKNSTDM